MAELCVGAYAAWSSAPETEWEILDGLAAESLVGGLEIPIPPSGELHRTDPARLISICKPGWRNTLTALPGTMLLLGSDPAFGLSSTDREGRLRALDHARRIREGAMRMGTVATVELHSAPGGGSRWALAESLREIRRWDWGATTIALEHCDARDPRWEAAKGFLSLADEAWAIAESGGPGAAPAGLVINWGRSAIEARDPEEPRRQIAWARERGLLHGLIFSGCSIGDALYGTWADSHAPFSGCGIPARSLLSRPRVLSCLMEAGEPALLGFKLQALPASLDAQERLAFLRESAEFLQSCLAQRAREGTDPGKSGGGSDGSSREPLLSSPA